MKAKVRPLAAIALLAAFSFSAPAAAQSLQDRLAICLGCHGAKGQSELPLTPSLGGQPEFFLIAQLFLFREGRRDNEVMTAAAKGLSNDDLRAFAQQISKLPPPVSPAQAADAARFTRGQALARKKNCGVCHNADFSGGEQIPRIANQREDYLLKSLRDYRKGARIGYGGAAMVEELAGLSDGELVDLAHFLAHQPAATRK